MIKINKWLFNYCRLVAYFGVWIPWIWVESSDLYIWGFRFCCSSGSKQVCSLTKLHGQQMNLSLSDCS